MKNIFKSLVSFVTHSKKGGGMVKKNIIFVIVLFIIFFGSECLAYKPAIMGGIRSGAALGLMFESNITTSATLRLGVEGNTSDTSVLAFIGGKWFLHEVSSRFPMFLSGGIVGYLGNSSNVGPYISVIFERFIDVSPLFLEFGIDMVNYGRMQLQVGYYF